MSETVVPGIAAKHVVITPVCLKNHGVIGAFDEAARRLLDEYLACQTEGNAKASFHLVLTVERPS